MAGYSASKAAAHSLTQELRPVLAAQGNSVHGVYPGGIDTDMFAGVDAPKTPPAAVAASLLDRSRRRSRRHPPRPERGSDGGSSGG